MGLERRKFLDKIPAQYQNENFGARAAVPAFANAHPPRRYALAVAAHVEKTYTNANSVYMSREFFLTLREKLVKKDCLWEKRASIVWREV